MNDTLESSVDSCKDLGEDALHIYVGDSHTLPIARDKVWRALNDPEVLQYCIKSCDHVTRDCDGNFEAVFSFGIGPIRKELTAKMMVDETAPPEEYNLSSRVSAALVGQASGHAAVHLTEVETGTYLTYKADIQVVGWFAKLGEVMLRHAAEKYMTLFFERFSDTVISREFANSEDIDSA